MPNCLCFSFGSLFLSICIVVVVGLVYESLLVSDCFVNYFNDEIDKHLLIVFLFISLITLDTSISESEF